MTARIVRALVALVLLVTVGVYRFNALGGALGGFDNDHFLHLTYGKQLQAGEQPLRDYLDSALQGARPSVTYELSAAAQRVLGNTLRSDALLTVTAVAAGTAATWLAASRLVWWPWALVCALLSALVSPRLYSYPKVVATSVAAWLIASYAMAPSRAKLVAFAAWTTVAFLFRHDYAVYAAVGFTVVIATAHTDGWRACVGRLGTYAAASALLVAPSVLWIQYYVGLVQYLRTGWELAAREAGRTRISQWPTLELVEGSSLAGGLVHQRNVEVWLYYVCLLLPAVGVAWWWRARRRDPAGLPQAAAAVALACMSLVLWRTLIRGNLEARFGDMAPPVAVLGAILLARGSARGLGGIVPWLGRAAASLALLGATATAVYVVGNVGPELETTKFTDLRVGSLVGRAAYVSEQLGAAPASLREAEADYRMQASGYLHRCTRPTDRAFVFANLPETAYFAERLFAGGRAAWVPGFYSDPRYSRYALERLRGESVPVVLAEPDQTSELWERFPLVADYLRQHYQDVGGQVMMRGHWLRVMVERGRTPTGSSPEGLPCFG